MNNKDTIKLYGQLAKGYDSLINEGGEGFNPYQAKHDATVKQAADARMADLVSRFAEVRAAWNAAVTKYTVNGKVSCRDLPKIEAEAGVSQIEMMSLKDRVKG